MGEYRIYTFSYPGEHFGGVVVVIAKSMGMAISVAEQNKKAHGFEKEDLKLQSSILLTNGAVAHHDDGDY